MAPRYKLTLFVTPDNSGLALSHLYKALELLAYTDYELRMVDILEDQKRAKKANVSRTPMLVYHAAAGDIYLENVSDHESVRTSLGLK